MSDPVFVSFLFLRLDRAFRGLQSNEKVVAEEEFFSAYELSHKRLAMRAYALTGMRADCDLMLLRVGADLEAFAEQSSRLLSAGVGKWLWSTNALLALAADASPYAGPPKARFLFVRPWSMAASWAALPGTERARLEDERRKLVAARPSVSVQTLPAAGLSDFSVVETLETDSAADASALVAALESSAWGAHLKGGPSFACVARDPRDLLASL